MWTTSCPGKGCPVVNGLGVSALPTLGIPVPVLAQLTHLPVGTNGYVSTWGAVTGICPPKGR